MKVAVIGTGKTGSCVHALLPNDAVVGPFHSRNVPTPDALRPADVAIAFVPSEVAPQLFPSLLAWKGPVVWGTTGMSWPSDLDATLQRQATTWVQGDNFSLGMTAVRHLLKKIAQLSPLLQYPHYRIHEIHHTRKKDAPSGTALAWQRWLGGEADITSERTGDIVGIHRLCLEMADETLLLEHQANDRALFARGALWAAELLYTKKFDRLGFFRFEDVVDTWIDGGCP